MLAHTTVYRIVFRTSTVTDNERFLVKFPHVEEQSLSACLTYNIYSNVIPTLVNEFLDSSEYVSELSHNNTGRFRKM